MAMNYIDYLRFYKLTHCFIGYDVNLNGVISAPEISAKKEKCNPFIPLSEKEMEIVEEASEVASNQAVGMNIKEFFAFFNYRKNFERRLINGSPNLIGLEDLVTGLEQLGLALPKFIADEIKQDGDPDMQSLFDFKVAFAKFPPFNLRAIETEMRVVSIQKAKQEKKFQDKLV